MAVRLGVIQMVSSTSIEANLDRLDALLAEDGISESNPVSNFKPLVN